MSDELPPPRRAEKKAQSRRRIVDAAREVFFRDGFMEANLDEVAKKAGVAKGTLYRYFDSKAELYVAVLAHNGDIFVEKMRDAVAAGGPAPDLVRRLGSFYFRHWTQHPDYFQIFWAFENQQVFGDLPPGVIEEVSKLWERCVEQLTRIIEQGVRDSCLLDRRWRRGPDRPCGKRGGSVHTPSGNSHSKTRIPA